MSQRFEQELSTRVNEVLHYLWDPIGGREELYARDEYDMYVPDVCSLLNQGATADQIARHLDQVVTERMELSSNLEHSRASAHTLLEWRAMLLERHLEKRG